MLDSLIKIIVWHKILDHWTSKDENYDLSWSGNENLYIPSGGTNPGRRKNVFSFLSAPSITISVLRQVHEEFSYIYLVNYIEYPEYFIIGW